MSYDYKTERAAIFTESGQVMFLKIRDNVFALLREAGAVRMYEAVRGVTGGSSTMHACMDRMVELGEIREITTDPRTMGQYRVFVKS